MVYDLIVIGGGLMGSSAAWQYSRQGKKVLMVEKQNLPYTSGSSFGNSRITRALGSKDDIFATIQRLSTQEIRILVDYLREATGDDTWSMGAIYTTSPVSYMVDENGSKFTAELDYPEQTSDYEIINHQTGTSHGINIPENHQLVREYGVHTGMINPKILLAYLHRAISLKNGVIAYGQKVLSIDKVDDAYSVMTQDEGSGMTHTYQTKKLIIAAGPFTAQVVRLFDDKCDLGISPKRVFSSFFTIKEAAYDGLSQEAKRILKEGFPIYYQYDAMFYAMYDDYHGAIPVIKTGGHAMHNSIENLDTCWSILPSEAEISWSRETLYRYIRMHNIPLVLEDILYHTGQSCVYSMTEDGMPIVTALDSESDVVCIGGMNGVGAKGCLAYGRLAVDLLAASNCDALEHERTNLLYTLLRKE